jgi:hypothetical protein
VSCRAIGVLALALVVATIAAACGGGDRGTPGGPPLPTPQASLSAEVAATVALVRSTLADAGYQLVPPRLAYRPSEPAVLTQVPRAVIQVSSVDPDTGFVVVYELPDEAAASAAATELAAYLGSGLGQSNFPTDAQFSVAQVGSTIVFTWWSRDRSGDPAAAQGAYDVIRTIGRQVPVLK